LRGILLVMNIREANIHDLKDLNLLYDELDSFHITSLPAVFQRPRKRLRDQDYFVKAFSDPERVIFLAEDKEIIGLVEILTRQSSANTILVPLKFAVVVDIVVKKQFQGKGIGHALMEQAETWAKEQKASLIELDVWEFNKEAKNFYESLDYETVTRKMWKRLKK
jgi:ribosomal protein S18 acetylase RimI-like enzyme